jgi:CSLREA domain-containing protein
VEIYRCIPLGIGFSPVQPSAVSCRPLGRVFLPRLTIIRRAIFGLCFFLPVLFLQGCTKPAGEFIVNSSADGVDVNPGDGVCRAAGNSPTCTLRAAIQEANAYSNSDTIRFNLPAGDTVIHLDPSRNLPEINEPLVIDVTTQPGYSGEPIVRLESENVSGTQWGFWSNAFVTIRGMELTGFDFAVVCKDLLTMEHMRLHGNDTGVYCMNYSTPSMTVRVIIQDSEIREGGMYGVKTEEIYLSVVRTVIEEIQGFGIHTTGGSLSLSESSLRGNDATHWGNGNGGGIHLENSSPAEIRSSLIENNTAPNNGGGIFFSGNAGATLTIRDSTISGNRAENGGGVFLGRGSLSISQSTVAGNQAQYNGGGVGSGGGLESADITQSTLSGNSAGYDGGGIYFQGSAASLFTLSNSTISGNAASIGGGLRAVNGALSVTYSTFAGNFAYAGGGIFNSHDTNISNSVFANNSLNSCAGVYPILSLGHNLEDGSSCPADGPGDISATPAALGPLDLNGGPTRTHALLAGSPAIDGGDDSSCPPDDQRGVARPQGAHCDIGAFESTRPTFAVTPIPIPTLPPLPTTTRTPLLIVFDPVHFSAEKIYAAGPSCNPKELAVQVKVSPAEMVYSLGLFYRLEEKEGTKVGPWGGGLAMIPQGGGWYQLTLYGEDLPGTFEWSGDAWIAVQFIANGKDGEILARSEVYRQVTLGQCHR